MAANAASHNPTGEPTGSPSGPAPPVNDSLVGKVAQAAQEEPLGQSQSGQDQLGNNDGQTVIGEAGKEKIVEEVKKDAQGVS